jgi:hypothetical protein
MAAAAQQLPVDQPPGDLEGVNPTWVQNIQKQIEQQAELLKAAYELDPAMEKALRDELHRRMLEQVPIEREYQRQKMEYARKEKRAKTGGGGIDPAERLAFMGQMKGQLRAMPLYEQQVADWVDKQLPPEKAALGRKRLEDLWQRRDAQRTAFMADSTREARAKGRWLQEKRAEEAPLSPQGKPLPNNGPKGTDVATGIEKQAADQTQVVQPNQDVTLRAESPRPPPKVDTTKPRSEALSKAESRPPPTASAPAAAPSPPLPPAPPLDEWDKYVVSVAERYAFSDVQVTKARAILRDLRGRAHQYRLSHADDYAKAELLSEARLRGDRLKQLNAVMDALFAELKARLEGLPTMEQKQRADSTATKRPGNPTTPKRGGPAEPPKKEAEKPGQPQNKKGK